MSVPPFIIALMMFLNNPSEIKVKEGLLRVHKGLASFYSHKFNGKRTAFGEIFNNKLFTAAHPTLPHNTMLEVTNLSNNKKVIVRVNDRGPFGKHKRLLDISRAAASELGLIRQGVGSVQIKVVGSEGKLFSEDSRFAQDVSDLFASPQLTPVPITRN